MKNKISIVIPLYNCEKYIKRCLDSLFKQTYNNYEIVIVDDGSTDKSYEICNMIAKDNSKITLIHQQNCGVCAARNKGISIAKGEFMCFVDADDWVSADFLETLYNGIENGQELSVVGIKPVYEYNINQIKEENNYCKISVTEAYQYLFSNYNFFGYCCNKLYLSRLVKEIGKEPFDPKIHFCEDTYFNAQYLTMVKKISFNNSKLYYYYQRVGSATNKKNITNRELTIFDSLNSIEEIYNKYSPINLPFLYVFYLNNYLSFKIKNPNLLNSKIKDLNKINNMLNEVLNSSKINIKTKLKFIIKFRLPRIYSMWLKIKGGII